jgi:putative Mg2+ transporter-C (MgtC) family protein
MGQTVDLIYILKSIGLTILFVGLIGFERQRKNKIAGLTTHLLVALGAVGLTIVQQYMVQDTISFLEANPEYIGTVNIERQRIVAQIVSGIGFLGTGAIIKTNGYISGLTTASTLWIAAIIGIIFGFGYFWLGITLSLSILFILTIIKNVFRHAVEDPHH